MGTPQSILLLGGTSDIGLAIVDEYVQAGPLRVVLAARPSPRLDEAAARLTERGCAVETVPFDARDTGSHAETLDKAIAGGDIDLTVVAFGILGDQERAWTDVEAALETAEVNYVGAVSVGVLLGRRLTAQGHGTVVALSSVAAERPRRSNFMYGSSKAGMDSFYLGLGEALRPAGVRVVVVRPGFVHSSMTEGLKAAPLSVTPKAVATAVVDAVRSGKELIWVPTALRGVMSGLRHVPRALFRRLPL